MNNDLKKYHNKSAGQVSVWLDDYDDIFSDFDPRPFQQRALSDDFLVQLRNLGYETEGGVTELTLLVPAARRKDEVETTISSKLHNYFKTHFRMRRAEYKKIVKKGLVFTIIGLLLMLIASYASIHQSKTFLMHLALVVFQPTGWFMAWWGLDMIFYRAFQQKKEIEFYNKFSRSQIRFYSIK